MKKLRIVSALLLVLFALGACTTTGPLTATSNPVGSRTGEASARFLFGAIPLGGADASIYTAAMEGGISEISTVDTRVNWNPFITTVTTVITGE